MISFELNDEQRLLQNKFRKLAKEKLQQHSLQIDSNPPESIDVFFQKVFAEYKLNALIIPKEYGGNPLDWVTLSIVFEELSYGCAGLASCFSATLHAVSTLLIGGSEAQKRTFLPLLLSADGSFASWLTTEEKGGSDTTHFTTTARCEGDNYVLNGEKMSIINTGNVAFYIVWGNLEATQGRPGINAFIVPKDIPGMSFGAYDDKSGLRNAPTSSVRLDNVKIPKENLISFPGSGYLLLAQTLDIGRAIFGSIGLGIARAALEEAIAFAKGRIVLNKPIIRNQGVNHQLADISARLEAARFLVWKACRQMDLGEDYSTESTMAKLLASELAYQATGVGLQIMGHRGYMRPSMMEKLHRDASILRVVEGTNIIQKVIISSQL